ncbi:MarR family winged helix-turn-helix transcriptional regulator [Paenibacillus xanthanilyticus]|uniref:MarR family winged helix-turn-helix transcriptional regulator n=1 Tax=Paenibacillus xanthanilyticus TaxID=1783531 RepID=A0ABV8K1B4_9BACL
MNEQRDAELDSALRLFIVLSRSFQSVSAHAAADIRSYGLNTTEFGVLDVLYHKGEMPLQQIGDKVLMSSGNITYVVDKLEKKEYVRRKSSPSDRRVIFAEITEKGRAFLDEVFPKHERVLERALNGLTHEERLQAAALLKKLGRAAQEQQLP